MLTCNTKLFPKEGLYQIIHKLYIINIISFKMLQNTHLHCSIHFTWACSTTQCAKHPLIQQEDNMQLWFYSAWYRRHHWLDCVRYSDWGLEISTLTINTALQCCENIDILKVNIDEFNKSCKASIGWDIRTSSLLK